MVSNSTYFSKKASSSLIWSCCWLCMSFLRTSSCACKWAFINSQFSFWCRSIISDQCFVCSTTVCFTAGSLTTSLSLENKKKYILLYMVNIRSVRKKHLKLFEVIRLALSNLENSSCCRMVHKILLFFPGITMLLMIGL